MKVSFEEARKHLNLIRRFFRASTFYISYKSIDTIEVSRHLFERLKAIVIYAV